MSVKILIADDHPLFRAAMCHALASVEHIELVETSTFPDTLTSLEENDLKASFESIGALGAQVP